MTADTITPNVPLLLKALAHVEAHPEEWVQETWRCGTAACFAGHAAMIDGGEWVNDESALMFARDDDPANATWKPFFAEDDRKRIDVGDRAKHILGLSTEQADNLFAYSNTLDDLRAEVSRLVGDWDRLAVVTLKAAANAINTPDITPSAYADPALDVDTKHLLWTDLKDAIDAWCKAVDCDVDYASLEPKWRDPKVYANHCRGLVDDAVHKLIGRKP